MDKRTLVTLALLAVAGGAALLRAGKPPRSEVALFRTVAEPVAAPTRETGPPARLVVYVAGEVVHPGVYELPAGSRAEAAVRAAGGVRSDADSVAVNLAQRLSDGEELAIPARGEAVRDSGGAAGPGERRSGRRRRRRLHGLAGSRHGTRKAPLEPVDVNAAGAAELQTLPGIGPSLAERIVEFRDANGPFASLDDLLDVAGTSPRLLEELQPYAVAGTR